MKKILQIAGGFRENVEGKPVSGGVPSFLYNYCTKLDSAEYHFDFLALRNQCFEPYRREFESRGWELYSFNIVPDGFRGFIKQYQCVKSFLKIHKYDAVHINMGSFFPVLSCAFAAKKAKIRIIIAHSHSTGIYSRKKRIFANFSSFLLTLMANRYCACSKVAAYNLFSKRLVEFGKVHYIKNAIDTTIYAYNSENRNSIRSKYGIKDEFVIGHVGRFVEAKNHGFLINIFFEYHKIDKNAILLLVGEGVLRESIEKKVKKLHLEKNVIFAGQQRHSEYFYSAMDAFVFPSIVEGLGIVAIEAQTSGLPCYISENVPKEVNITDLCSRFDLNDNPRHIAHHIYNGKKICKREEYSHIIKMSGYGIEENINVFKNLYQV